MSRTFGGTGPSAIGEPRIPAPDIDDVSMDGWDAYAASRRRITQGWVDANVPNAVVLTGDVHRNWPNGVKLDYKDPASPVVGSELVCTSITSTGSDSAPSRIP